MERVLFYGVPAGCSFGSIVALEWLGKPYHLSRVEMMEHPWNPLYAKINPQFQTPALLLESGETLTESMAILKHIAARNASANVSSTQDDRLTEMLAYLNTDFFSAFNPLWVAYEMEDLDDAQKALLRTIGHKGVVKGCTYLNDLLADREWLLGGGQRSIADAYLSGIGRWIQYHQLFDLEQEYPHLACYLQKLANDPAAIFAKAIEKGEEPAGSGAFMGHVTLDALRSRLGA
ncbi:glutathione S-transferase N-terminal domain-containing protein [Thalassospira lucentensis]|uniref:glutathione S-transferase N-terminal domain-containing protein n=1 Tax=Thalassospira lucentensis TaxID=168935 RepID=UPI003D27115F